jgi:Flp pilus assembly pilin Flp
MRSILRFCTDVSAASSIEYSVFAGGVALAIVTMFTSVYTLLK